jgi:hypothetical protein
MDEKALESIEAVRVVDLQPGDRLAVILASDTSVAGMERAAAMVKQWAGPDVRVGVFPHGTKLEIVRQEAAEPIS